MKRLALFLMTSLVLMFATIGCEKDTGSAVDDETQAQMELQDAVHDEENDYLLDWGIDDGDESNMFSFSPSFGFPKIMDTIPNVVRFGRRVNHRFRREVIITRLNPDSILVSITRKLDGRFVIASLDTTQDTVIIYRKPLTHIVKRRAIFVKRHPNIPDDNPGRGRWKLRAVTLGAGASDSVRTIQIHQVTVYNSAGDSIVFANPLETWLTVPDDIPTFHRGEMVTIRVMLENNTPNPLIGPDGASETVLLHYGRNRSHHDRKRFTFVGADPVSGYNVYEGIFHVGQQPFRVRHAIVDAIDNGTIFDDDASVYPYNSTTWSAPYRVMLN